MDILEHSQINSQFFYSTGELDMSILHGYSSVDLSKYSDEDVGKFINAVAFGGDDTYLHIVTSIGTFLYLSATDVLVHDKILDYLKLFSKSNPVYYFSNVDYFTFGRFGVAEGGKILRYLSYNVEADDEEDVVKWIGKPHTWEYDTHTFYTKKKLEDMEMDFGSDEVCDMITFYIPDIDKDIDVYKVTVYSKDLGKIKNIKASLKPKYRKLSRGIPRGIYEVGLKYRVPAMVINIYFDRVKNIVMHSATLAVQREDISDPLCHDILHADMIGDLDITSSMCRVDFHNMLLQLVESIERATLVKYSTCVSLARKYNNDKYRLVQLGISPVSRFKMQYYMLSDDSDGTSTNVYLGTKFDKRLTDRLFKKIMSLD